MLVYHFLTKEHAINNVAQSRLKIAKINELNDPFEFYINLQSTDGCANEEQLTNLKNHYNGVLGFLCFSKRFNSPVQWSHYAENHHGICLEFKVPKSFLVRIKYRRKPLKIDVSRTDWKNKFVLATKSKYRHWSYEKEYRMIVDLKKIDEADDRGLHFMPFSEKLELTNIYTGVNCELSTTERKSLMSSKVKISETKKSRTSYSILNT